MSKNTEIKLVGQPILIQLLQLVDTWSFKKLVKENNSDYYFPPVGLVTNNFFIHHHSELLIQIYQFLLDKMRPKNIYIPVDNLPGSTVLTKGCYEYRLVFE